MGVTFKPVFNRTGKKNKKGLYSIHLRVTVDGRTAYLNPKLPKITKEQWAGKPNKWIKDNHPSHFLFNKKIQDKLSELLDFSDRQQLFDKAISLKKIEEFFYRRGDRTLFNDYIKEYIRTRKFGSDLTMKKYKTFENLINEFNPGIRFNNLEENLFFKFRDFLFEKGQNGNTVDKYFDPFKKIVKDAYRRDYLPKDPFEGINLEIKKPKPKRVTLSLEEYSKIEKLVLKKEESHLQPHLDMFLLLCNSGVYYNDLRLLKADSIVVKSGKRFLVGDRYKGGERYISPVFLFPIFERIMAKYNWPNQELPLIEDQPFNRALKKIATAAMVNKEITNKSGRHTYIDRMAAYGYSELMIKKFVGHTKDSRSLKHYFEIEIEHILQFLT